MNKEQRLHQIKRLSKIQSHHNYCALFFLIVLFISPFILVDLVTLVPMVISFIFLIHHLIISFDLDDEINTLKKTFSYNLNF